MFCTAPGAFIWKITVPVNVLVEIQVSHIKSDMIEKKSVSTHSKIRFQIRC